MEKIFEIEQLEKSFKSDFWKEPAQVLKGLTFGVDKGSLCGFLGPNGAGKTTMIKILLRFINSNGGKIRFNPVLGKNWNEIRKSIGYFPERPYFYPHLKGIEFARYIGQLQGMKIKEIDEKAYFWAEKLKIDYALERKTKDYSKGMLQRLGFVVSIIHDPKLLILDEPLSGLDPIGRRDFKRIMTELCEQGTTVFFSSHIVSDVEEVCNKVVVLMDGSTFYEGDIDKLIEKNHQGRYEFVVDRNKAGDINIANIEKQRLVGEDLIALVTTANNKDGFLQELLKQDIEIRSMNPLRPTLEEIVYTSREER